MQRHFERQLDRLKTDLIRMGSLVDDQIEVAMRALFQMDLTLVALVREREKRVNEYDNLIDEEIEQIFATAQPVASDLRLLMAALKMNSQLERVGDIAENIAERAESLAKLKDGGEKLVRDLMAKTNLSAMADVARKMVRDAFDSFINADAELGKEVRDRDDVVDRLDRENVTMLIKAMREDPRVIEAATNLVVLSRHLERLADHATNIAEDVVFLVEAKLIKHHGVEPPPEEKKQK